MSIMELICILCSVGWVIGLIGIAFLLLCGQAIKGKKTTTGVDLLMWALLITVAAGFIGCAAEDRVCAVSS